MKRCSIVLGIVLCLSGCASYYKAPDGVPTAKISFVTNVKPVMIQRFDDSTCSNGARLAYIGYGVGASKYRGPVYVEANKDLIITARIGTPSPPNTGPVNILGATSCVTTTLRFVPIPGNEYEVEIQTTGCNQNVYRIVTDSNGSKSRLPEESVSKLEERCFNNWL